MLPLQQRGKKLFIGISDPTNLQVLDEIKFATGKNIEAIVVEQDKMELAIEKALEQADTSLSTMMGEEEGDELDNLLTVGEESEGESAEEDDSEVEDAPVVRFVNKVLVDAIKRGASDLHFEPYEKFYRVRFRVDGVLEEIAKPPQQLSKKLAARIKVMSRLDVSERRVPQDGRIKFRLSRNKAIDFRVNTCPTLFGEKCVMRILDSDAAKLQIDQLGYEDSQKDLFLTNLQKPYGMFLVTGPTGSGKTVSLYTGINILNQEDINISTAEDPVEINLPGVNQVQVDEKTGMTFSKALKAFLRQDPDIILVGRDPRFGDRIDRGKGGANRTHGDVHPAYQRRSPDPDAPARHGHQGIRGRYQHQPDYRAAPGPAPASRLQADGRYAETGIAGRGLYRG